MRYLLLMMVMLVGAACTNTTLVSTWSSPKPPGYHKLLVVGISTNPATRRIFEDTFSREAATKHVIAIPSYQYAPETGKLDKARLAQVVGQSGADALLIMRLVAVDRRLIQTPGYWSPARGSPYGYYDYYWYGYYEPPRIYERTTVILENNVYDAKSGEIMWSGTTRTIDPVALADELKEVSKVVIEKMSSDGLLATR